jgi:transcriptional regulator with XRE-family HTH domain
LLRGYRVAANLTQEELAERSGVSIEAIGALERGSRRSPRPSTVAFLVAALKLDAQQSESLTTAARGRPIRPDPAGDFTWPVPDDPTRLRGAQALLRSMPTATLARRGPLPAGSRMPVAPNPVFVGRGDALRRIAVTLRAGRALALSQLVASTGLGGLGKTQLAVEFAHRYGRYFSGGVYWLSFASAHEIPLEVAACAGPAAMDLAPGTNSMPLEERVERVQRAWQSPEPRLLVFDSCEEEALLYRWRPPAGGCRVLVTSRRGHWSPTLGVTVQPLDVLSRHDSIELLRHYRPDLEPSDPCLNRVSHVLGDLPLALHLAGSYLYAYRPEVDLEGYLAELRRPSALQHASLLGRGLDESLSPTHHVQSVARTFDLCLGRLDERSEADRIAIALLARLAWMAPGEAVRRELLASTLDDVDPLLRTEGLRRLGAVGLVEEGDGWLRLHRLLVHFVRHEDLDPRAQTAVDDVLIGCAEAALRRNLAGSALAAVIPHLVDAAASGRRDAPRTAELCRAAGVTLQLAGDVGPATGWLERALEIREEMLGPDHPDTATSLNDLALVLRARGEWNRASDLLERALAIRERVLGHDHPDTITIRGNLATGPDDARR